MTRTGRGEVGDAVTETVLVVPALMLLVMVVIQAAMWWHAQHVVTAVAREGVRAGRLSGATTADGKRLAIAFLAAIGPEVVTDPAVEVERDDAVTTARASGRAVAVIPGLALPVRATATGRTEGFAADR